MEAQETNSDHIYIGFSLYHQYVPYDQQNFGSIWDMLGLQGGYKFQFVENQLVVAVGYEIGNEFSDGFLFPHISKRFRMSYVMINELLQFYSQSQYTIYAVTGVRLITMKYSSEKNNNYNKVWLNQNLTGILPDFGIRWHSKIAQTGFTFMYSPLIITIENNSLLLRSSHWFSVYISN